MVVNDDAGFLDARGVPALFASKLAPTGLAAYLTADTRQTLFPTSSATNKSPC